MKELVLIRHAKSSWELNVEDWDRPLTKKGIERIRKIVLSSPEVFSSTDVIYTSNANRATHTTLIMVNTLSLPLDKVNITKELYTFKISNLVYFVKNIPNTFKRLSLYENAAFS